jgi:acetylornithine deacetylase/succinyl-diaminopimelate desuccinylase-like protein
VIGEATRNRLYRGHRGRTELLVHVKGRSVHASVPESGANPLAVIGRFLQALETIQHPVDPDLGASSVAPTLIRTDQTSPNVVPGECMLTCDWRNTPSQSGEDVRIVLSKLVEKCLVPGTQASVTIPIVHRVSYTGLAMDIPADNPAFILPADHPAVAQGLVVLGSSIGLREKSSVWKFATDGGHFAPEGLSVVGFGPGEEELAHTVDESIELDQLALAMQGNRDLARFWPARVVARG